MVITADNRRTFGHGMDNSRIRPAGPGVFSRPAPGHTGLQNDPDGLSLKSRNIKLTCLPSAIQHARARPELRLKDQLAPVRGFDADGESDCAFYEWPGSFFDSVAEVQACLFTDFQSGESNR